MNRSYDNSAQSPKVKYSVAYSMEREFSEKRYCDSPAECTMRSLNSIKQLKL